MICSITNKITPVFWI